MARSGVVVTVDNVAKMIRATNLLASTSVMVGVPAENEEREDDWHGKLNNAEIGYLMENGIPENNVPARPHLVPGVRLVQGKITDYLGQAARLAFEGKPEAVLRAFHAAGIVAVNSVKGIIRAGIPPPLADSTIRARAAQGRAGAKKEMKYRAAGAAWSLDFVKPLINTGQYLASITHVLRRK